MATELESLQISINAKAKSANQAIDSLVGRLDILSKSLGKINRGSSNISGLANGVDKLGRAMQTMNSVSTADFTRLATNLEKMGKINVASLNSAASSMSHLSRALSTLSGVSANSTQIVDVANSIGKLGGVSVQRAITNMPQLASAMNNLMTTLSRSPQVSRNLIDMTNALANLASQGQRISTATNSMVNGLGNTDRAVRRTSKSTLSLAATFGKFYASYFLVIRGMKSLWKSIESTADYFEAYNYFNVAMTKIGSDWSSQFADYGYDNAEAYAKSFNTRLTDKLSQLSGVKINAESGTLEATATKNLGLNIREITQYASQLASVTNSVGQTGEVSLATASAFTKLGADMSSLFNMDYSQVMNNLQSGLIGQSRALYRYGIDITNATLQTLAYELGVEKAVSEMTQMEKQQLRIISILDQSRVSWGDQANTINSTSNQIRLLKNNLSETGMILGQLFIPILNNLLPALNGLSIAFKRLLTDIAGFMGISIDLDSFGQGYSGIEDDINAEADAYDNATESAKKYRNQILSFDDATKLQDTDSDSSGSGASGSINLENEILKATKEYEKAWQEAYDKMENQAEQFADKFEVMLEPIKEIFQDIAIGDWFAVGEDVSDLAKDILDFVNDAIKNVNWKKVGKSFGKFMSGIDWLDVFEKVLDVAGTVFESALVAWFSAFKEAPIETALVTAIGLWKFTNVGDVLSSKISDSLMKKGISVKNLPLKIVAIALTWEVGFDLGKELGKLLNDFIPILADDEAYNNFTWFGDNGFFPTLSEYIFGEKEIDPLEIPIEVSEETIKKLQPLADVLNSIESSKGEFGVKIGDFSSDISKINKLTDSYFSLANKQNLSNDEQVLLIAYGRELIELIPDLKQLINEETGEYTGQEQAIRDVIEAQEEKMLKEILSERQKNILQEIVDSTYELSEVESDYLKAKEEQIKLDEEHANKLLISRYRMIALEKKFVELSNEKGPNDAAVIRTALQIEKLSDEMELLNYNYDQASVNNKAIISDYEKAQTEISELQKEYQGYSDIINSTDLDIQSFTDSLLNVPTNKTVELNATTDNAKKTIEAFTDNVKNMVPINIKTMIKPETDMTALEKVKKVLSSIQNVFPNSVSNTLSNAFSSIKLFGSGKLKGYATGGFPNVSKPFVVGENGPELYGGMFGRPAVANSDSITSGIEEAAYRGMIRALAESGSGNTRVNVTLEGDARNLFKAVQKEANNYTRSTGETAFLF